MRWGIKHVLRDREVAGRCCMHRAVLWLWLLLERCDGNGAVWRGYGVKLWLGEHDPLHHWACGVAGGSSRA